MFFFTVSELKIEDLFQSKQETWKRRSASSGTVRREDFACKLHGHDSASKVADGHDSASKVAASYQKCGLFFFYMREILIFERKTLQPVNLLGTKYTGNELKC